MVHVVVVVILSTSAFIGFSEEWLMLLFYCIPLLLKVSQRGGSCCGCYIVFHYCLKFYREVVHVVVVILYAITV